MDNNLDKIATDLYGKIQTRFSDIKMGDENAEVISKKIDIPKARFFEFEYIEDGEPLGTIVITLDQDDGIVIQVGGDLTDSETNNKHHSAFKFIRSFKKFAKNHLLNFDVQDIGKSNLDKRDYEFQAKSKEQLMMENKMFGTSRISYQNLGEARLIVKHSQPVNAELAAGRTMHISSIYIENADGERFKYPHRHLHGARALAEHVNHGGNPYDEIGKYITKLSEELSHLRKFKGYVTRQHQLSETLSSVTNRVIDRINEVKKEIQNLQRPAYYVQFAESFVAKEDRKIPETIMNDWIDRLTIRTFNEDLKTVLPFLYNIVDDQDLPICELSAKDLFKKVNNESNIQKQSNKSKNFNPEEMFESVIEYLVTEDKDEITGPNKSAAVKKLNKLLANQMPGGTSGALALKGIIDDPRIIDAIKNINYNDAAAQDKAVRDIIVNYIDSEDPDLIGELTNLYIESPAEIGGDDLSPSANSGPEIGEPSGLPASDSEAPADTGGLGGLGGGLPPDLGAPPEDELGAAGEPPAPGTEPPAPGTEPPAPGTEPPAPGTEPPASAPPVQEGMQHKKAKIKAKFFKAKAAGATLETQFAEGMTIRDAIRESGLTPCEAGFGECDMEDSDGEEPTDEKLSGVKQILNSIEGFWNDEDNNFTIGGTRVKIIIKKSFDDGEYSNASEDDVKYVMNKVDKLDPTNDQEHNDILRLAGVDYNDPKEVNNDGKSIEVLMKELSKFGKRRKFDSVDKHKMNRMIRNNNEKKYRTQFTKFR